MTAYLDNNVIVSIEDSDYTIEDIKALLPNESIILHYSSAHIYEAESFPGNEKITKPEFLKKRFSTISEIFKNNYLYFDVNISKLNYLVEEPQHVYNTITDIPLAIQSMKVFSNLFTKEQKDEVRKQLGIEIKRINNYKPSEVIEHLNTKLAKWGNHSFIDMIEHGMQLLGNNKGLGIHNRIASVFELLDMFGYWKDEDTSTSNYARLWDSQHTFFASHCDYFISDDRRTRNKAAVVFDIYKLQTKVIPGRPT